MQNKTVLALMQIKGISRRTIIQHIPVTAGTECSAESISSLLAKSSAARIPHPTRDMVEEAIRRADKVISDCESLGIRIITYLDPEYPKMLKKSTDYPSILYVLGDLSWIDTMNAVAIIGTREPSPFGYKVAHKLGEAFANRGFADISGLAVGCDTGGHTGCLSAGGRTAAVLAGGLDKVYPASNRRLADEILRKGGALISEYPPYAAPYRAAFVERDRLQAALSDGVFVIETREQGGTHHAVRFAGEYGRVIGCFSHPEKYAFIPEAAGNRMLVENGTAVPVANDSDLDRFCELLKDYHEKACRQEPAPEEYEQLSFDSILQIRKEQ